MSLHRRSAVRALSLVLALLLLVSCAQLPEPAPTSAPAAATTDTPAPLPPPTAAPTAGVTPAAPATAAVATTTAPTALPEPLFGPPWGDRAAYHAGLVASEQGILAGLPGLSEYRIELEIAPTLTAIGGVEQVRYTNNEKAALNEIYMRLFPNALGGKMVPYDVTVNGAAAAAQTEFADTALRVPLARPLAPGESVVVGLRYDIEVPETLDKGYGLLSYTDGILAADTPYAPIPVYNEEGWNVEVPPENADTSFNDVSLYMVRVTAPARVKLVATGVEVARATLSTERGGEQQVVTYEQGPARDFFLAGSTDYVVQTAQAGETRVNSYALPGQEAAAQLTLQAAVRGIEIYGNRMGPYPYTELDIAATPMLALGIEYPGTVGISAAIYEPDYAPRTGTAAGMVESTLAHELAHQWFYNLVGNDQIDQPWLDEALAQYSTYLYFLDAAGEGAAEGFRASWGSRWDRTDRAEKPVGLPAGEYTSREYGSIVYGRGPMFLAALADRMGQATFDRFLKNYSARYRWGIATTSDFETMASQECDCDLSDLYKQWLEP